MPESETSEVGPSRIWKRAISVALCFHLFAICVGPFGFSSVMESGEPSTPVVAVIDYVRPYIDPLYLNHGYAFFAPDPGPAYLVHYRLEFDDGRSPEEGWLPDREQHWPRLLYHRHFMLSEQLNSNFTFPEPPPDFPPEVEIDPQVHRNNKAIWRVRRKIYEEHWGSFEKHLKHLTGASRVRLERVEHALISPYQYLVKGRRLTDKDLYLPVPENPSLEEPMP